MKTLGTLLLCTSMTVLAAPAFAGFEFTPRASAPAQEQAPMAAPASADAPMPILPVEPVSGEVLAAPDTDPVLSTQVSRAEEPVYVRRHQSTLPAQAMKSQPMEPEVLLSATANPGPSTFAERLVINPYPLEGSAVHGGDMGVLSVEQAMLEETGMLRPVGTPGTVAAGMATRAKPNAKASSRAPEVNAEENIVSNMTPLPGESAYAAPVEQIPVAAMPTMPKPAPLRPAVANTSSENGSYTEAVGFGRDLPLALALSQVVPPEYSYAFAQNVNVGTTVSWQGGKPWNVVLDEMLAPNGMKADIQDGQIVIKNANT